MAGRVQTVTIARVGATRRRQRLIRLCSGADQSSFQDERYFGSSTASAPSPTSNGAKVSTMTAVSSKLSSPIERS
jgi:hypothetical protein